VKGFASQGVEHASFSRPRADHASLDTLALRALTLYATIWLESVQECNFFKDEPMYIGIGTVVAIIVLIILLRALGVF
jgi:hypothetical protein